MLLAVDLIYSEIMLSKVWLNVISLVIAYQMFFEQHISPLEHLQMFRLILNYYCTVLAFFFICFCWVKVFFLFVCHSMVSVSTIDS